ncbi:chloride transporter, chloride channel (ClC) family protein [Klebsiella variicola]|nr:chloride transporter, chloride channel (ClC) family protein [Klebsiella variicola]VAR93198.1 chloride transporter, chloride channel (ClC) family protein [Klebsiella variicola]
MNEQAAPKNYVVRLLAIIAIATGLAGMALALLLHTIQHYAFGNSIQHIISGASFLQGVNASEPLRRVGAIILGGRLLVLDGGYWGDMGNPGSPSVPPCLHLPVSCLQAPRLFMLCFRSSRWRSVHLWGGRLRRVKWGLLPVVRLPAEWGWMKMKCAFLSLAEQVRVWLLFIMLPLLVPYLPSKFCCCHLAGRRCLQR